MGAKKDLLLIFGRLEKLEEKNEIRIIRIKNRFDTPLNDALINFMFTGKNKSFIVCELQLILKKSNNEITPK